MQIFKTYFRILNKKKGVVIIYFSIFLGLAIMTTILNQNQTIDKKYESTSDTIAIIDRDGSAVSKSIVNYLSSKNEVKKVKDSKKAIDDALYWHEVSYIVTIPKHFEKKLIRGESDEIITNKMEGTKSAAYIDEEIKQYVSLLNIYHSAGYEGKDMIQKIETSLNNTVQIDLVQNLNQTNVNQQMEQMAGFYGVAPYAITSIPFLMIGGILVLFQEENVKKRSICSATTLKSQNSQMLLASLASALMIVVLIIVISIILSKGELLGKVHLLYYSINVLVYMAVCVALSFLLGNLFNSSTAMNGCSNIFSLGFCFLGGVFAPLSIMPKSVVQFSHLIPTYWYTKSNELIGYMGKRNAAFLKEFYTNTSVMLAFTVALICVSIAVSKKKQTF